MYSRFRPVWQASPWGHRPSSSAPCAVPMRLSRIGRHIKDEPRAKQRASLGVFSSHFSSVSRNVRSAVLRYFFSPLVHVAHTIMHTMVLNLVGLLKFSSSTQVLQLYSCSTRVPGTRVPRYRYSDACDYGMYRRRLTILLQIMQTIVPLK